MTIYNASSIVRGDARKEQNREIINVAGLLLYESVSLKRRVAAAQTRLIWHLARVTIRRKRNRRHLKRGGIIGCGVAGNMVRATLIISANS